MNMGSITQSLSGTSLQLFLMHLFKIQENKSTMGALCNGAPISVYTRDGISPTIGISVQTRDGISTTIGISPLIRYTWIVYYKSDIISIIELEQNILMYTSNFRNPESMSENDSMSVQHIHFWYHSLQMIPYVSVAHIFLVSQLRDKLCEYVLICRTSLFRNNIYIYILKMIVDILSCYTQMFTLSNFPYLYSYQNDKI